MDIDDLIEDVMIDAMQEVRGVLFTAMQSGMTIEDVCQMARHAETPCEFVDAVMMLASTMNDADGDWTRG